MVAMVPPSSASPLNCRSYASLRMTWHKDFRRRHFPERWSEVHREIIRLCLAGAHSAPRQAHASIDPSIRSRWQGSTFEAQTGDPDDPHADTSTDRRTGDSCLTSRGTKHQDDRPAREQSDARG